MGHAENPSSNSDINSKVTNRNRINVSPVPNISRRAFVQSSMALSSGIALTCLDGGDVFSATPCFADEVDSADAVSSGAETEKLMYTMKTAGASGAVKVASIAIDVDSSPDGKDVVTRMLEWVDKAADEGARLVVFPECSFGTGCTDANGYMEAVTGIVPADEKRDLYKEGLVEDQETTQVFLKKAAERNIYIVFNTYECDHAAVPPTLYNVSALVGPEGFVGKYRKVHMPGGETLLARPGDGYPVFETAIGRIGILICFDFAFPEAHRCLALNGAEIIVISTAAPLSNLENPEADDGLDFLHAQIKASSYANNVYYVVSNNANPGALGHSMICGPNGKFLAETEGFGEGMAIADLGIVSEELLEARIFGNCGLNVLKAREPQTYGRVCDPIR